jgi:acyl carrier protein
MTTDEIRSTVLRLLTEIAPEADPATIQPDVEFRDQLDLDSMDLLNFVVAVDETLGVEIPESEYGRLGTLDRLVAYVAEHQSAAA